jgi:hypothetical protein
MGNFSLLGFARFISTLLLDNRLLDLAELESFCKLGVLDVNF